MENVHLSLKLFSHRDCDLSMEVLRSSVFIAAICSDISATSTDTVLKPLICLIEFRRSIKVSFLLIVPMQIDVTILVIILLLNGFGPSKFGIYFVNAPWVTDAFSPMIFTYFLKFRLSTIINPNLESRHLRFDPSTSNGHFHLLHYLLMVFFFSTKKCAFY